MQISYLQTKLSLLSKTQIYEYRFSYLLYFRYQYITYQLTLISFSLYILHFFYTRRHIVFLFITHILRGISYFTLTFWKLPMSYVAAVRRTVPSLITRHAIFTVSTTQLTIVTIVSVSTYWKKIKGNGTIYIYMYPWEFLQSVREFFFIRDYIVRNFFNVNYKLTIIWMKLYNGKCLFCNSFLTSNPFCSACMNELFMHEAIKQIISH